MSQPTAPTPVHPLNYQQDLHAGYAKARLYFVSLLALATLGIYFSIRTGIEKTLEAQFLVGIDPVNSSKLLGSVLGAYFLGFAFTIAIGSPLLDYLGMGRLLGLSSLCVIVGVCGVVFAGRFHIGRMDWYLWSTVLLSGIGAGLVETVINPLVATLYPAEKTHKLNVLHAWWPGGIVIGGLYDLLMQHFHVSWQLELGLLVIPAAIYGLLLVGAQFPPTERVAAGVPAREMGREVLKPFFLLWFCCMFFTAASELAPMQWVEKSLTSILSIRGIWIIIYVNALMFVMRHFAGPMAHRLSPVGLMWVSCLLASLGLLLLSMAQSPVTGILAATVWGAGVCYMWPTMLAAASERFPRGGALLMGLMGTAGTLSIAWVLPQMGRVFDHYKVNNPETVAAAMSFRVVAILPAVLLVVFGAIWMYDKSRGGYAKVREDAARELLR